MSQRERDSKLVGWKEIAAYLQISVRTAQEYERDRNLPIHRQTDQEKPRVFAYGSELDAWTASKVTSPAPVPAGSEPTDQQPVTDSVAAEAPAADQTANPKITSRRQWLKGTVVGLGTGLGLSGLLALTPIIRRGHASPNQVRIDGVNAIGCAPDGRELWRHPFPARLDEHFYDGRQDAIVCVDVDGDSRVETLLIYRPAGEYPNTTLVCLGSDGRARWEFSPGRSITDDRGRAFGPPFWVSHFALLPPLESSRVRLVVISNHSWSFPEQVAVLDAATGELLSEYWHRGHLLHLAVANLGQNDPTVLLGGVNDSPDYKQATLLAFDHRRIAGSSCSRKGLPSFPGLRAGTEQQRVFFPKTPISKLEEFNRVVDVQVHASRIVVIVAEGIAEVGTPYMVYELDFAFRPLNATPCDTLYARLQADGYQDVDQFSANLLREIEVI